MKIKIGDTTYNSEKQPIMVILTNQDKENIKNMSSEATRYCGYPSGCDPEKILEWMKDE